MWHPAKYAELLAEKMSKHNVNAARMQGPGLRIEESLDFSFTSLVKKGKIMEDVFLGHHLSRISGWDRDIHGLADGWP